MCMRPWMELACCPGLAPGGQVAGGGGAAGAAGGSVTQRPRAAAGGRGHFGTEHRRFRSEPSLFSVCTTR